ncbi:Bifunctional hemolysin/adenylate cyclase precursor [Candidatus Arcanobacter lacustris]|uniref:Bifunctional hemolysin/adenylate cyclase n=1 Tax=Candidatus Arcanibacter lacustris TaxID=1607817 RepID=A0A0F5MN69_9RICK|nr:Bifunctional hemolysin/adenylate cyclase precursor [Candidatus Arcanobacter lacustris]
MSDYKINYYHAKTMFGHFYVQFDGIVPEGMDTENRKNPQTFFGKNSEHKSPIDWGEILNEETEHTLNRDNTVFLYSQSVSKEQFEDAYRLAIKHRDSGGGSYHITEDSCITFSQFIYYASGGQGHFINNVAKDKIDALKASGTLAAKHIIANYYDQGQIRTETGALAAEFVAFKYGVSLNRVIEQYDDVTREKYFTILPKSQFNNEEYAKDSSKKEKSTYSNSDYQGIDRDSFNALTALTWMQVQEEQERLHQANMNNPGRMPLNSGVNSGSTSSTPASSPTKGPIGSTPSKNMPSSPIPSSPSTPSSSNPFASTPISLSASTPPTLGKNSPGNSGGASGASGHGATGGFGNSPSTNPASNPSAHPSVNSKSAPSTTSKNMPSFAPINANAGLGSGSGSGSVPGSTAGSEPLKGPTSSAPSPTPIKGPSGNVPSQSPIKGPSGTGSTPIKSPTSSQAPIPTTSPSQSPIKTPVGAGNSQTPIYNSQTPTSSQSPIKMPIGGNNQAPIPTPSSSPTSGSTPTPTSSPIKAPFGMGQNNAPNNIPKSTPNFNPGFNPGFNPAPTPTPTPFKGSTPSFNNQPNSPWNQPSASSPTKGPNFNFPWNQPTQPTATPSFQPTFTPIPFPSGFPSSQPKSSPSPSPSWPSWTPTFRPDSSSSSGRHEPFSSSYSPTSNNARFDPFGFSRTSDPLFGSRSSSNGFVNDPTWQYSRGSTANGFEYYRSYANARGQFANSFSSGNNFWNSYSGAYNRMNGGAFSNSQYGNNYGPKMADAWGRSSSAKWAGTLRGAVRYARSHVSPLVFDLKCDGLELLSYKDSLAYFDIDNDGFVEKIGWAGAEEGQLARDLNGNGKIDDITELFGDDITSAFYKLAMLDSNNDGVIDKNDKAFHELLIWQDLNGNGYSEKEELSSLSRLGIKSISLKTSKEDQEIEGNLISESSSFSYENGKYCKVYDVHYANDDMNSWYKGKRKIEGDAAYKKIKKDLLEFSKYMFEELSLKSKEVYTNKIEGDWVRETIMLKTEAYIEKVTAKIFKYKQQVIEKEFSESQQALKNIATMSDELFKKTINNLVSKIAKDVDDKNDKAKTNAIKELKSKFQQQKDDIHSRYLQILNTQIAELSLKNLPEEEFEKAKQGLEAQILKQEKTEKIEAQKKFDIEYDQIKKSSNYEDEAKSAKLKYLNDNFEQQKADVHESYIQESALKIKKISEKIKEASKKKAQDLRTKFIKHGITESEYNIKLKKLEENCKKEIASAAEKINKASMVREKKDIDELRKEFRAKYLKEQNILSEQSIEKLKSQIEDEKHLNEQLFAQSIKSLLKLYFAQNEQKKADLKESIEYLKLSIKEEANHIYDYVISESKLMKNSDDASNSDNTFANANPDSANVKQPTSSFSLVSNIYNNAYDYFFAKKEPSKFKIPSWLKTESYSNKTEDRGFDNNEGIKIDPETLFMPMMRGYGQIPSLHIAMSIDPLLKSEVMNFMLIKALDLKVIQQNIMNILYQWAGVTDIDDHSKSYPGGANIEARKVHFIEKVTGQPFKQLGASKSVGQYASTSMQKAWDIYLIRATKNLLIQGPLMPIFPKALYSFTDDEMNLNSSLDEILINAKKFATDHDLGYDFWVQIGYVLASNIKELNITMSALKARLSELAGEFILVGLDGFSLIGDNQDNYIKGTFGSDYIKGLDGNDKIEGKEGSDFIEGGDGDDEIYGGEGIDRLHGGDGNDRIYGGSDKDFIYGDNGDDSIYGEEGDDYIEGGEGADYIDGGPGTNTLSYGMSPGGVVVNLKTGEARGFDAEGDKFINFQNLGGSEYNDILIGDDQDNEINGEGGDDEIRGGKGNDSLFGATGTDRLYGEEGDDILTGFEGPDHMDGGAGTDTADYSHPYATVGVNVDLSKGVGVGGYAHGDTYVNMENVKGSRFNDVITGDDQNNKLEGAAGDDVIHGGSGNDLIIDQQGHNMLYGDEGDDLILSVIGNFCFGGEGKDTISYQGLIKGVKIDMKSGSTTLKDDDSAKDTFTEFENVVGTNADDEIIGDDNDNEIAGLGRDDIIHAGAGNDKINPGDGDDIVYGEAGDDYMMGSAGKDLYDGGEGFDTVDYSQEPDRALYLNLKLKKNTGATFAEGDVLKNIERIIGTKFDDVMIGDNENNQLYGGAGDDKIYGGEGSDVLSGGEGKNELYGEDGDDTFELSQGENLVYGGAGTNGVTYQNAKASVEIDLANRQGKKSTGGQDTYEDIHNCIGSKYDDKIIGNNDANKLFGLEGDDYIDAGGGADTIDGGKGNNGLLGGSGNDRFILIEGSNQVDGGSDIDTAIYVDYQKAAYYAEEVIEREVKIYNFFLPSYAGEQFTKPIFPEGKGIVANLTTGIVEKPNGLNDHLTNVENIEGTHYDDIITGDDKANKLEGNNGNDIIDGGKGDDIIISGRGHSTLYGGEGNDMFKIIKGTADIYGGEGNDSVNLAYLTLVVKANLEEGSISYGNSVDEGNKADCKLEGIEAIRTTKFNDIIYDSKLDNHIETGEGNDIIYISDGFDIVDSGDGDDVIYLNGSGEKRLLSGTGEDKFVIMPGFTSNNKTDVMIGDFKLSLDKIDLSNLVNIKSFSDLKLEQITVEDNIFSIIHIEDNKEIALFGIEMSQITSDNFIF